MAGFPLTLDLPTGSDNMATVVAKTATALSAIQSILAPSITPGQLALSGTVQFNGALLNAVGGVQFANGAAVATAAPALYFSGGELFALTPSGAVKITAGGVVNVAGSGGIGGDYPGHVGALVSLDYASTTYSFVHDPGAFSDLKFAHAKLTGALATITVGVDAGNAVSSSFNFKSFPASGISLMAFDASTSGFQKAEAAAITNALTINDITVGTRLRVSEVWSKALSGWLQITGSASQFNANYGFQQNSASSCNGLVDTGLRKGDRVLTVVCDFNKTTTGLLSVSLWKAFQNGSGATQIQAATTTATGAGTLTLTISSPTAIAVNEGWHVVVVTPALNDQMRMVQVTWDHP